MYVRGVSVCVCVCERERERETEHRWCCVTECRHFRYFPLFNVRVSMYVCLRVCVCMCVCVRERKRESVCVYYNINVCTSWVR